MFGFCVDPFSCLLTFCSYAPKTPSHSPFALYPLSPPINIICDQEHKTSAAAGAAIDSDAKAKTMPVGPIADADKAKEGGLVKIAVRENSKNGGKNEQQRVETPEQPSGAAVDAFLVAAMGYGVCSPWLCVNVVGNTGDCL